MNRLRILTNWLPAELCINIIPVEWKTEFESILFKLKKIIKNEFSEIKKADITFKDVWYNLENYSELLGQAGIETINYHGRGIGLIEYCGPSFSNLDEIYKIISNKHDIKKMEILIDGMEISCSIPKKNCIFQKMIKPQLKHKELAVYHGGISWIETTFELDIDESFEENKLVFQFSDCGENGYILNSITYDGENMEKEYDPFKEALFDLTMLNYSIVP